MISFANQDCDFILKRKTEVKTWIRTILIEEGGKPGELAYIFCSDAYLLGLNLKYLKHKTLTDIITFDYSEKGRISGDIFISIDRVRENALKYSKSFEEELGRVMAHGALHLSGYEDKTAEQESGMRMLEEKYLPAFPNLK